MLVDVVVGLAISLASAWVVLVAAAAIARPRGARLRDLARQAPEVIRLLRGLARDRTLPRSVRWRVRFALVYDIQPFTLIPDFLPVIGFADNFLITAWALRSTIRRAGRQRVAEHWQGDPDGLTTLLRLCGLERVTPRDAPRA